MVDADDDGASDDGDRMALALLVIAVTMAVFVVLAGAAVGGVVAVQFVLDDPTPTPVTTPTRMDTSVATVDRPTPADDRSLVFADDFEDGDLAEWRVETTDRAEATVDDGRMRLRVHKCNTATATRKIGSHDGAVYVAFDWIVSAEQWWESTDFDLLGPDGEPVEYEVVDGTDLPSPEAYETRSGWVRLRTTADGPLRLRFSVTPSSHCSNGDHANTFLYVDDLRVTTDG